MKSSWLCDPGGTIIPDGSYSVETKGVATEVLYYLQERNILPRDAGEITTSGNTVGLPSYSVARFYITLPDSEKAVLEVQDDCLRFRNPQG